MQAQMCHIPMWMYQKNMHGYLPSTSWSRLSLAVSAAYCVLQSSWSVRVQTIAILLSLPMSSLSSCYNSAGITDVCGCIGFIFLNAGSED